MPPDNPPARSKKGLDIGTAADLGDLLYELSHDKDVRKDLGKIIRKAKPDSPHAAAFADLDLDDKIEQIRAENEAEKLERQRQQLISRAEAQRQALLEGSNGRKYTEEQITQIEALMQKKGLVDYDDGATLWAASQPPIEPPSRDTPRHGETWEFPEFDKFAKDPKGASYSVAHAVIDEIRRRNRAA